MSWIDDPIAVLAALPAFAIPLFIFVSAAVEYVVPPYWGDMFVIVGFFLARQGATSAPLVFVLAVAGSTIGAAIAFGLGRRYGIKAVERFASRRSGRSGSSRVRNLFRRFGERALLANRFLPVVRSLMLYGAGAFDLRFWPSMAFTGVSNVAWIGFLAGIGAISSGSWDQVQQEFDRYSLILGLAALVAVAGGLAITMHQARRASRERGSDPSDEPSPPAETV